jgi:peroxiredoxin
MAGRSSGLQLVGRWVLSAAIAAAAIIGFFVVIGLPKTNTSGPPVRATQTSSPGDLSAGSAAPDFTATAFDGSTVRLSDLKGKVVLINFFASWCIECRREMPAIQALYQQKRGAGFEVIGVDTWDTGDGQAFYRQMGATFPAVADPQKGNEPGAIAAAFGIVTPSLPISVFIDRDGKIHQIFPGGIDEAIIRAQLSQMGI